MPERYNIMNNNCQNFAYKLLRAICEAGPKKIYIIQRGLYTYISFAPSRKEQGVMNAQKGVKVIVDYDNNAYFTLLRKLMAKKTSQTTLEELAAEEVNPRRDLPRASTGCQEQRARIE